MTGTAVDLERNKSVVHGFVDAWNDRDVDRFDRLMGRDAVLHLGAAEYPCDPDSTRAIVEEWTTAFPDWRFELLQLVAEGDRVVAHMPYSGTFSAALYGVPPTGRFALVDEMVIFRIEDEHIAEAWEIYDLDGMWKQLGVPAR